MDSFDFSDYAEHKITEENIGYKMLQQAGWKEGMGLGSQGQGITAPVDKYAMKCPVLIPHISLIIMC